MTDSLLARGPEGITPYRKDLSQSREQLEHFRDWVYSSIRPIAQTIAGQPVYVGRKKRGLRMAKSASDLEPLDSHPLAGLSRPLTPWTLFPPVQTGHSLSANEESGLEPSLRADHE